jgi:hypothetical protein
MVLKKVAEKIYSYFLTSMHGMSFEGQLFYFSQVNCFRVQYLVLRGNYIQYLLIDLFLGLSACAICHSYFLLFFFLIYLHHYSYIARCWELGLYYSTMARLQQG